MKWTRANVEAYARKKGLTQIQVDGIPEGFIWKESDVTIGEVEHKGRTITFIPLSEKEPTYA